MATQVQFKVGAPSVPTSVAYHVGPPIRAGGGNFAVWNAAGHRTVNIIRNHPDQANMEAIFNEIKQLTLQGLASKGRIFNERDFKLVCTANLRSGEWRHGNETGAVDYVNADWDQDILDRIEYLFSLTEGYYVDQKPSGEPVQAVYRRGCMSSISESNGFNCMSPQTREKLPKTMGAFCEGHLERAVGFGREPREYYRAMTKIAVMDTYRREAKTAVEQEIRLLDNRLQRLRHLPDRADHVYYLEQDRHRLSVFLKNLNSSDQFAVNFAACYTPVGRDNMERARNLSEAAQEHLEETKGVLDRPWFGAAQTELCPQDRQYCDVMGTLMLQDRVNEFIPYCRQKQMPYANTSIEHNLLRANVRAPSVQGLQMLDGLYNQRIKDRIQAALNRARGHTGAIHGAVNARVRDPATAALTPEQVVADFKLNIYPQGW